MPETKTKDLPQMEMMTDDHKSPLSERVVYIDLAKAIAIFFVVLGHTVQGDLRAVIYSFHMPLFFLLSGMLLKRKQESCSPAFLKQMIVKKLQSYYLLYLIWGLFYTSLSLSHFLKLMYGTRECLYDIKSLTSLWFLPVLTLAGIFSETALWLIRKKRRQVPFVIAVIALFFTIGFLLPHPAPYGWPLGMDISFVAAGFLLTGMLLRGPLDHIRLSGRFSLLLFAGSILALAAVRLLLHPGSASMHKNLYHNAPLFLLHALAASVVVLALSILAERLPEGLREGIVYVGRNTFGIFVLHKPMVKGMLKLAKSHGMDSSSLLLNLVIVLAAILCSLALTQVITRVCPMLIGKKAGKCQPSAVGN